MNSSGAFTTGDIRCTTAACGNNSVEDVLYSQNTKFRAAFDVNGDGLGDNRDLFALGDELVAGGAGQAVLDAYTDLLLKRADVNSSGEQQRRRRGGAVRQLRLAELADGFQRGRRWWTSMTCPR